MKRGYSKLTTEEAEAIYHNTTNISPSIKYFYTVRPDIEGKLLTQQADMLKDLTNLKILNHVVTCGRGFGKTMISASVGLYFADEWSTQHETPLTVLIVSSQDALYRNMGMFFDKKPELRKRLKVQPTGPRELPASGAFQFADNGSSVITKLSTVKAVEGNRADVIIFDETQDQEESVILKGLGCSKTDILGKVIFIGTPFSEKKGKATDKQNWFINLAEDPKHFVPNYPFHLSQYSSELTNWNNVGIWKATWSRERYDAECLGKVTPRAERCYFGVANVKACCLDIEPDPEGGSTSKRYGGVDCGYKNTVYVLTERIGTVKRKVLYIGWWRNKSIEEVAPELGRLIQSHNPYITQIDSRSGNNNTDYTREIKKYTTKVLTRLDCSRMLKTDETADGMNKVISVKQAMRGQLLRKVRERNFIIPMRLNHAEDLKDQMLKYTSQSTLGDDLVDGCMISCYEPPEGFNSGTGGSIHFPALKKKNYNVPIMVRRL